MSFISDFNRVDRDGWRTPLLRRFESLLAPRSPVELERLARDAAALTRKHFGRTMRLFAPVYLSNECVNNCAYCGFSRDNPILRVTLSVGQVVREARHLAAQGFRHVLLVAGEHPKFVSDGYLEECIAAIRDFIPTVAIEVGPMETAEYRRLVEAGAEGLVVYQETYDRDAYAAYHTAGPKRDFDWRLECPERGYAAGFRRLGVGALLGLSDWRGELLRLAAHLEWLQRHCWKAAFTVSLPRLRPAAGGFSPAIPPATPTSSRPSAPCAFVFPRPGSCSAPANPPPCATPCFPSASPPSAPAATPSPAATPARDATICT